MRSALTPLLCLLLAAAPLSAAAAPTFLHTPPRKARAGSDLTVGGSLFGGDVDRVLLRYRLRGAKRWEELELARAGGDQWRGVVPGAELEGGTLEYYVVILDSEGTEEEVWKSEAKPQTVSLGGAERAAADDDEERPARRAERPRPPPAEEDEADEAPKAKRGAKKASRRDDDRALYAADADPEAAGEVDGRDGVPSDDDEEVEPVERTPRRSRDEDDPSSTRRGGLEDELLLFAAEEKVSLATLRETPVADAPAIVSVIDRAEIVAMGFRTAADVIKALPGFETSRDVQGHDRVAIRGIRSDPELLVLYDGHKLNNVYDARALLRIPAENLERVEAIRGPGSALYGSGAFLGVVNLVPRRVEGVDAAIALGTRPLGGLHVAGGTTGEALALHFDADVLQSFSYGADVVEDSLSVKGDLQRQGLLEDGAALGPTGDEGLLLNVGGRAELKLGERTRGSLTLRVLRDERTPLVGAFDVYGVPRSNLAWTVGLFDVRLSHAFGDWLAVDARLWADVQWVDRLFELAPPGMTVATQPFPDGASERTAWDTLGVGADVKGEAKLGERNTLTLGLSFAREELTSYAYETNFVGDEPTAGLAAPPGLELPQKSAPARSSIGAFVQDEWRVVDPLNVLAGVRVDAIDDYAPAISPRVGAVFAATGTTRLKLLYGTAFRAPTFQELFEKIPNTDLAQGRFEGEPALEPVTITTFEGGVEQLFASPEAKIRVRGDAFYNLFRNRIEAIDTSGNQPPLQNREAGVDVFGTEAEIRFERGPRSFTTANVAWFRARDKNPDVPEELSLLTDVPQLRFFVGTQLPIGELLDLSARVEYGAERRSNARSRLETLRRFSIPAYTNLSAQLATRPILAGFSFAVVGENLLDEAYVDDVPRPDRLTGLLPREGISGVLLVRRHFGAPPPAASKPRKEGEP